MTTQKQRDDRQEGRDVARGKREVSQAKRDVSQAARDVGQARRDVGANRTQIIIALIGACVVALGVVNTYLIQKVHKATNSMHDVIVKNAHKDGVQQGVNQEKARGDRK